VYPLLHDYKGVYWPSAVFYLVLVSISCGELSPTDATVSLQMPTSITEGNNITISVDLSNVPGAGLEVDLVATLSTTPGTTSEYSKQAVLGRP